MAGTPRPPQPSALDGFRRLERTRRVAAGKQPVRVAVATLEPARARTPRRRSRSQRAAGAARLLAFVAALVAIVGTSVSLASSGRGDAPVERAARAAKESTAAPVVVAPARAAPAEETSDDGPSADEAAVEVPAGMEQAVAEPAAADPVATAGAVLAATAAPRSHALPFTGPEETIRLALLAGALLVLLGMLVQVAGQPLPARARHRR